MRSWKRGVIDKFEEAGEYDITLQTWQRYHNKRRSKL